MTRPVIEERLYSKEEYLWLDRSVQFKLPRTEVVMEAIYRDIDLPQLQPE